MTAMGHRDVYQAEVSSLRAQRDEAREELRQLKQLIEPQVTFPPEWKLTGIPRRILLILSQRTSPISKGSLFHLLYGSDSDIETGVITVFVSKLRQDLRPFGIEIPSFNRAGYQLTPESRSIVRAAINQSGVSDVRSGQ